LTNRVREKHGWRTSRGTQAILPAMWRLVAILVLTACLGLAASCRRPADAPARAKAPVVVSLVPAATDLIVGMGAADHLAGISTYCTAQPGLPDLPRVGDYASIDWERMAAIRPDILIVFMAEDRMPPAIRQKADAYGIRLANVRIERLEDVFTQLARLGDLLGEAPKASAAAERLRAELAAAAARATGQPPRRVLLVRDLDLRGVVGRQNFLDDLLESVGGRNVIESTGWPEIDREQLLAARPEVIIHLLPGAHEALVAQARQAWQTLPVEAPVHILTEWYLLQGGSHVGQTAGLLARCIQP
jgi:ABC-type Fe3+-hydroxamate transport system substrate-binding protein